MSVRFQLAARESMESICGLFRTAAESMRSRGLEQWEWGVYPSRLILEEDAARGALYQMEQDGRIIGAFALVPEQEAQYAQLTWHFGVRPATLHRLVIAPEFFGRGLARQMMVFVKEEAKRLGYDSLRLDTSSKNRRALKLFRDVMTREAGIIYFDNRDIGFQCFDDPITPYHCFESPLTEQCPMLPVRMFPAFRYGDMTPWGGDGLRQTFGKEIPDERTGESMEISAIPGLESRDDMGVTLPDLMDRYGMPFTGKAKAFPLLLKMIAARDRLSVQVHPDD
ncbi:MAG: GNAT family N-acetyltransferase, partial [Clostridia bacterium]|nr:GNAT family N-acetyltransferase [Clostridia bacterium]